MRYSAAPHSRVSALTPTSVVRKYVVGFIYWLYMFYDAAEVFSLVLVLLHRRSLKSRFHTLEFVFIKLERIAADPPPWRVDSDVEQLRRCISVLFAFARDQQTHAADLERFAQRVREWLVKLVAVLLRVASCDDHRFC